MKQQLEKEHHENLASQFDMKDAQFATVLLKTEEGVRKEVEDLYKSKMQHLMDEERRKVEIAEKKAGDASLRERDLKEQLVGSMEKMDAMEADGRARLSQAEKRTEDALASERDLTKQLRETVEQMTALENDANERVRDAEKRAEEAQARERTSVEELRSALEKMKLMKGDEEARLKLAEKRAEDALARERMSSEEVGEKCGAFCWALSVNGMHVLRLGETPGAATVGIGINVLFFCRASGSHNQQHHSVAGGHPFAPSCPVSTLLLMRLEFSGVKLKEQHPSANLVPRNMLCCIGKFFCSGVKM